MNRTELKKIIKEAILELVDEGKLQGFSSSAQSLTTTQPNSLRKSSNHLAEMIRTNAQQIESKKGSGSPDVALLSILADTAQTTFVRQKETEQFGYTSEEKERFDSLFPSDLKEHFNKLFDK